MAWIGAVTGVVRCGGGPWEPHPGESSGTDFRGRVRRGYGVGPIPPRVRES